VWVCVDECMKVSLCVDCMSVDMLSFILLLMCWYITQHTQTYMGCVDVYDECYVNSSHFHTHQHTLMSHTHNMCIKCMCVFIGVWMFVEVCVDECTKH